MGPEYGPGPPDSRKQKRSIKPGVPDLHADPGHNPSFDGGGSLFGKIRMPRQAFRNNQSAETNRYINLEHFSKLNYCFDWVLD